MVCFFQKSKKAAIEVQFSWIFVLIVGALILLFFMSVVKTTEKSSDQAKYADLKGTLKNILSQSESDVGTTHPITIPALTLTISCSELNIEKSSTSGESLDHKTFFSPNRIEGRDMIIYSMYWEMPYSADYFLYVTSREARYNFVNTSSCYNVPRCKELFKSLIKALPSNTTYQVVQNIGDVKENNYYKERFILFNKTPLDTVDNSINNIKNEDVTAINIALPNEDLGSVTYYKKKPDGTFAKTTESAYAGFPMLLGAVVSEDELYECNVKKSLLKFKVMSKIYNNRTIYLKNYFSGYDVASREYLCSQIYGSFSLSQTIFELEQGNMDYASFNTISQNAMDIKSANEDALLLSCPLIY